MIEVELAGLVHTRDAVPDARDVRQFAEPALPDHVRVGCDVVVEADVAVFERAFRMRENVRSVNVCERCRPRRFPAGFSGLSVGAQETLP